MYRNITPTPRAELPRRLDASCQQLINIKIELREHLMQRREPGVVELDLLLFLYVHALALGLGGGEEEEDEAARHRCWLPFDP